jgi:hypothetical protein
MRGENWIMANCTTPERAARLQRSPGGPGTRGASSPPDGIPTGVPSPRVIPHGHGVPLMHTVGRWAHPVPDPDGRREAEADRTGRHGGPTATSHDGKVRERRAALPGPSTSRRRIIAADATTSPATPHRSRPCRTNTPCTRDRTSRSGSATGRTWTRRRSGRSTSSRWGVQAHYNSVRSGSRVVRRDVRVTTAGAYDGGGVRADACAGRQLVRLEPVSCPPQVFPQ